MTVLKSNIFDIEAGYDRDGSNISNDKADKMRIITPYKIYKGL